MTFFDKVHEEWPEERPGALVTEVKDGGWAAIGRLNTGDIITAVDGEPGDGRDVIEGKNETRGGGEAEDHRVAGRAGDSHGIFGIGTKLGRTQGDRERKSLG